MFREQFWPSFQEHPGILSHAISFYFALIMSINVSSSTQLKCIVIHHQSYSLGIPDVVTLSRFCSGFHDNNVHATRFRWREQQAKIAEPRWQKSKATTHSAQGQLRVRWHGLLTNEVQENIYVYCPVLRLTHFISSAQMTYHIKYCNAFTCCTMTIALINVAANVYN